jgi:transcriptional regulator with XRE-family HTH domain
MITLKELREVSGLSQKEVCYATNVSPTRLSLFENKQGELSVGEQEQLRSRIIKLSAERVKHVRESSRIVQLTESSRSNSRANSKKYSDLSERERFDRRKALLMEGGMTEKQAEIGAGIRSDVRGMARQWKGPKNGH